MWHWHTGQRAHSGYSGKGFSKVCTNIHTVRQGTYSHTNVHIRAHIQTHTNADTGARTHAHTHFGSCGTWVSMVNLWSEPLAVSHSHSSWLCTPNYNLTSSYPPSKQKSSKSSSSWDVAWFVSQTLHMIGQTTVFLLQKYPFNKNRLKQTCCL